LGIFAAHATHVEADILLGVLASAAVYGIADGATCRLVKYSADADMLISHTFEAVVYARRSRAPSVPREAYVRASVAAFWHDITQRVLAHASLQAAIAEYRDGGRDDDQIPTVVYLAWASTNDYCNRFLVGGLTFFTALDLALHSRLDLLEYARLIDSELRNSGLGKPGRQAAVCEVFGAILTSLAPYFLPSNLFGGASPLFLDALRTAVPRARLSIPSRYFVVFGMSSFVAAPQLLAGVLDLVEGPDLVDLGNLPSLLAAVLPAHESASPSEITDLDMAHQSRLWHAHHRLGRLAHPSALARPPGAYYGASLIDARDVVASSPKPSRLPSASASSRSAHPPRPLPLGACAWCSNTDMSLMSRPAR
jgi:hypothetical protein